MCGVRNRRRSAGEANVANQGAFFFQAEDGIRYDLVTGVQTCALPICPAFPVRDEKAGFSVRELGTQDGANWQAVYQALQEIGRASCRERVQLSVVEGICNKK